MTTILNPPQLKSMPAADSRFFNDPNLGIEAGDIEPAPADFYRYSREFVQLNKLLLPEGPCLVAQMGRDEAGHLVPTEGKWQQMSTVRFATREDAFAWQLVVAQRQRGREVYQLEVSPQAVGAQRKHYDVQGVQRNEAALDEAQSVIDNLWQIVTHPDVLTAIDVLRQRRVTAKVALGEFVMSNYGAEETRAYQRELTDRKRAVDSSGLPPMALDHFSDTTTTSAVSRR